MKQVAILTACMGLGTYHPALHLRNELAQCGVNADIFLFEHYMEAEKRANIRRYQQAFHQDFRLAVAGHKLMSRLNQSTISAAAAAQFYEDTAKGYDAMIVFSGNWVDLLCLLEKQYAFSTPLFFVHLDCAKAPSWEHKEAYPKQLQEEIWLLGNAQQRAQYCLFSAAPATSREMRVFLYGGGWGMGNYLSYAETLSRHYPLDILLHSTKDTVRAENARYYLFPPEWQAWETPKTQAYDIPPLHCCTATPDGIQIGNDTRRYDFFEKNFCVVSKPGGGSFLDALAFETPLILLEPIAAHETANAAYYTQAELALPIEDWRLADYAPSVIQRLQQNLADYKKTLTPLASALATF